MQIEIKGHGLAALWRDLLANSDVTSTVAAGAAAIAISYAVWKAGQGIGHVRRRLRARPVAPRTVRLAPTPSRPVAPTAPARSTAEQWQRLDRSLTGHLEKAGAARAAHDRAARLTDALDLEVADLLRDLAGVSAYAGARRAAETAALMPQKPADRAPLAA